MSGSSLRCVPSDIRTFTAVRCTIVSKMANAIRVGYRVSGGKICSPQGRRAVEKDSNRMHRINRICIIFLS